PGYDTDVLVLGQDRFVGIEHGALEIRGSADGAHLGQIGRDTRSLPVDTMAGKAGSFTFEESFSSRGVARSSGADRGIVKRADVGDEREPAAVVHGRGRHGGSGDSGGDDAEEVGIGGGSLENAASEVDAGN